MGSDTKYNRVEFGFGCAGDTGPCGLVHGSAHPPRDFLFAESFSRVTLSAVYLSVDLTHGEAAACFPNSCYTAWINHFI